METLNVVKMMFPNVLSRKAIRDIILTTIDGFLPYKQLENVILTTFNGKIPF